MPPYRLTLSPLYACSVTTVDPSPGPPPRKPLGIAISIRFTIYAINFIDTVQRRLEIAHVFPLNSSPPLCIKLGSSQGCALVPMSCTNV